MKNALASFFPFSRISPFHRCSKQAVKPELNRQTNEMRHNVFDVCMFVWVWESMRGYTAASNVRRFYGSMSQCTVHCQAF